MSDRSYMVILHQQQHIESDAVLPALIEAGLARVDALRAIRRQRGIVLSHISEELALRVADALTHSGYDAIALPVKDYPELPRPTNVSWLEALDGALQAPSLSAIGKPDAIAWEDVQFFLAGLTLPAEAGLAANKTRENLLGIAAQMLSENDVFPLKRYLERDAEESVNMGRLDRTDPKKSMSRRERRLKRFDALEQEERFESDHPGLEGYCFVYGNGMLLQLDAHNAAFGAEAPGGHWLRGFHYFVAQCVERAKNARMPEGTRSFAAGEDKATYLYDDARAMVDCTRWWLNAMNLLSL